MVKRRQKRKQSKKKFYGISAEEEKLNLKHQKIKIAREKDKKHKRKAQVKRKKGYKRVDGKRQQMVAKIKGIKLATRKTAEEKELEQRLLVQVKNLPKLPKREWQMAVNPKEKIITDGKTYNSYADMVANKKDIYFGVILGGVEAKNKKLLENIYKFRRQILRDGFVMEVDLYGSANKNLRGNYYLGTVEITGVLIEEAEFIETSLVGAGGYLHELVPLADNLVKSKGGAGASLKIDNTKNISVSVNNVKMRFNYA